MAAVLLCVTMQAQIVDGKVYNFVNRSKGTSMACTSVSDVAVVATNQESYSQLWYAASNGSGHTLRNLANGRYLYSPNATSNKWTLVEDANEANSVFGVTAVGDYYAVRVTSNTGNYNYMHADGGNNIVCWESSSYATQWAINEVSLSEEDLTANWAKLTEIAESVNKVSDYQTVLLKLFTDNSCSELNSTYASYTQEQMMADDNYEALPSTLQAMALKMCTDGDWDEANYDTSKDQWDDGYAKKYRVQLYEPYNEPECAASALGINAHTNLNNPTGIFANMQDVLYVMVEGEVEDGAYLYLAWYTGNGKPGGYAQGVQLTEGLNVVPVYADGTNFCINYVVKTFDTSDGKGSLAKKRPLSCYEDLKIHIEGGYINGYYNKMGDELYGDGDTNTDWEYIEARATQTTVTVLGEYMTLQFPLWQDATHTEGNPGMGYYFNEKADIEDAIDEWDRVMLWERLLMGVTDRQTLEEAVDGMKSPYSITETQRIYEYTGNDEEYGCDYSDYYNVHGLALGVGGSTYMYGSWDHCGYHYNTMSGIMVSMLTNSGSHWGPAHEIGHQHQGIINMRGLTEVTNNLFSNVVLWCFGESTSRYNGTDGALSNVLAQYNAEGTDFFSNNIWAQTQMYYKLFLYYHVLGHNPKFYPRLFEMLRQDPMIIQYAQSGAKSLLHFYKKCCYASGEDLTEFFRAHGFFEVMTDRFVGDYSNAVYNQTQSEIDAAIAEIKGEGYPENIAVLFINDATGEAIVSHKGDTLDLFQEAVMSDVGSYASFAEDVNEASDYTYTVTGNTVTMTGSGGVGFVIRNAVGEIVAFSDQATFEISTEVAEAIASGEAEIVVTNSDNTTSTPVDIMASDDTSAKYAALGELLAAAQVFVNLADESGTKLGFYRQDAIANLITAYDKAKTVYDGKEVTAYSAVYDVLSREYIDVMGNEFARIGLVEGNAYRFTNRQYSDRSMSIPTDSTNQQVMGETTDTESPYDQQLWYFENSGTDGSYYLKNKEEGTYLVDVKVSTYIYATATETSDAYAYKLKDKGNGLWSFIGSNTALHMGAWNYKYGVLGWGDAATASQWYITSVESNQTAEALYNLQALISKTEDLIGDMADVVPEQKLALQDSFPAQPNYLSTNADHNAITGESDGQGLNGLLDDATDTYFHSEYRNNVTATHYLQVDLGSGNEMKAFKFNYTTRNNGNNCPTAIKVEGSADGSSFTEIETFDSGLPTGSAESWESALLTGTGYRYLRFSVTATENSARYFVMSSFGVTDMTASVKSITDIYNTAGLTEETIVNAYTTIHENEEVIATGEATQSELESLHSTLDETYYQPLHTIYENAQSTALTDAKTELQSWIATTTALLAECGGVTYTEAVADTEITGLQTTDDSSDYYVWTNAQSTAEGPISGLVDGYYGSSYTASQYYFHTAYNSETITDGLSNHHFTINLGKNNAVSAFKFIYRNRTNAGTNFPAEIVVYGSTDGVTYEKLTTLNDMTTTATTVYTSPVIEADEEYTHLRFAVTKNSAGGKFFHMAEFDLYVGTPSCYNVGAYSGDGKVTDSLMIATALENDDAQAICNYGTDVALINLEIKKLQAAYQTLYDAHNNVIYVTDRSELKTLIDKTQALLDACYTTAGNIYSGSLYLTEELGTAIGNELTSATSVYNASAVSEANYATAITNLQTAYDNLLAAQTTANNENTLKELIDETTALLDICGTVGVDEATSSLTGTVSLQTTEPEAAFYLSTNAQEANGDNDISHLVDTEANTIFHSSWSAGVGEHHYLQIDLGDGYELKKLTFNYTAGAMPHPYTIEVYAGDEPDASFTGPVATFSKDDEDNPLPTASGTAWTSAEIMTNKAYRYWRFVVTKSGDDSYVNSNPVNVDEWCFIMTQFGITAYAADESYYAIVDINAGSVTEELMLAANAGKDEAELVLATTTTDAALTAATNELQTAFEALKEAYDIKVRPVLLTTDPQNPVLYTINLPGRSAKKRLQYEPASSHMISVVDSVQGSVKQAFYFMPGGERTQVYILPYAAGEQVLAASNTGNGAAKVSAAEKGSLQYEQWKFVEQADDKYNIQPVGTSTYFSNYGGTGNKMGFYSSSPSSDGGSLFTFTPTTVEGSAAYNSLKIYYDEATKVASSSIVGGTQPGYYPETEAEAYNTAYAEATPLHDNAVDSAAYKVYLDAYKTLLAANEALVPNMPEEGKYYVIESACNDHRKGRLMYATSENAIKFGGEAVNTDAASLWKFTNEGYFENLQTGCAVSTASTGGGHHKLGETPKVVAIEVISVDGQVLLTPAGAHPLHAQDNDSVVVGWGAYSAGSASAWRIVEVEDMSLVNFALTIGKYRHAGLYLNYPVTIPEGVKAYIAHTPDGEEGTIYADELDGTILPARTAVIVKGDSATYDFKYTTSDYDGSEDLTVNKLGGSAYLKYQQVAKEGNRCCVFGHKGGEVGLYKNYVEYTDANGSQTDADENSVVDTDNGTHFKISANKIYYEYEPASVSGASAFRFRFNSNSENDGETTAIDNLILAGDAVIYNLYGQRIAKVAEPGIYIVNGKKIYVSEKMIRDNN